MSSFPIKLARGVELDARKLVDTRMLVAGSSGSGKSYTMRLIAEQTAGRMQTIVLDPEGEYTTLREKADLVIVGSEGEVVPTVPTAGKLARKLLELQVSAVIDLYELKIGDRRAFVRNFLDSMMSVPKKLWRPCIVMLDEAHRFCPERSSGQAESTDAVITLLSQGRKRGFCGILATQRLQKLHKDAAAETLNNLIGRTSLDTDVHRARAILGMGKNDEGRLRALKPGNWFGFGPAFVDVDGVCEFKARKATTTHPEPGKRHTLSAPAPSARIRKVLPELAELPQEVEKEAKDLVSMAKRVRELERDLRSARKGSAAPDPQAVDKAVQRALEAQRRRWEKEQRKLLTDLAKIGNTAASLCRNASDLDSTIHDLHEGLLSKPEHAPSPKTPDPRPVPKATNGTAAPPTGGGMQRILAALASSDESLPRTDLAIVAHLAPTSGTFSTYLGRLKNRGEIAQRSDGWEITPEGLASLGDFEPLDMAGSELVAQWQTSLGNGGIRRIFDALAESGPNGLGRSELAEAAGLEPSSGTYSTYLGRLKRKGLVCSNRGHFSLAAIFFSK
jgi:hypothetical protein